MKTILITDTHFGVKQNSMTWFNSQMSFMYDQLIPYIKSLGEPVNLYHLGDLFDCRATVNTFIAQKVNQLFGDLSKICKQIVVLAGNHDYYSPNENEDNTNTIETVMDPYPNVVYVTKDLYTDYEGNLFIPWFRWDDKEAIQQILQKYSIHNVFCHNDIERMDMVHQIIFHNIDVYSGHIHIPFFRDNLHNLGSTFALDFGDHNSERGFYVLDNELEFVPNEKSIRFWRYKDADIFSIQANPQDYVEIYIDQNRLVTQEYANKIKQINQTYHNKTIIPTKTIIESTEIKSFDGYNIEEICKENIPDNLKTKFKQLTEKIEV